MANLVSCNECGFEGNSDNFNVTEFGFLCEDCFDLFEDAGLI